MLSAHHLSKSYGINPILNNISFSLSTGDRVGLIGPNGCGKTTLLRILVGEEQPDKGVVVHTYPDLRIGYLAQGLDLDPGQTIQSALGPAFVSTEELETRVARLATALASAPDDSKLQTRYDQALQLLSTSSLQPVKVLAALGLAEFDPRTLIRQLSGGQKTRLMLARILLDEPHLLLLDEPTNHLDLEMLAWLEGWLSRFKGAVLVISHDRAFLDNTVTRVLELDPVTHSLQQYDGNYSAYVEQKLVDGEKQLQSYQDQQNQLAQLRAAAAHIRGLTRMKKGGKADPSNTDGFSVGFFGNRATKNVAGRAKHIEKRIEQILTEEHIEKPRPSWQMKLEFETPGNLGKDVVIAQDLSVGYLAHQPLLSGLDFYIRAGQRIALTGPNGCGKTTLLRTIAGQLAPLAGNVRLGASVSLGYMTQEQETLDPDRSALEMVQRVSSFNQTEARNFLHYFLFSGDDPLRPSGDLSFGERARLQLALLVSRGCTFLLLDEPLNHLDIPSRARFEQALENFEGTVLAVVHDRYFIERFASDIWLVEQQTLHYRYAL
jgi:ATP-binding cassette subfamily F protein 3